MEKFDQQKYINQYNETHYERLTLRLPIGKKELLKQQAQSKGMSVNSYIVWLIDNDMNKAEE